MNYTHKTANTSRVAPSSVWNLDPAAFSTCNGHAARDTSRSLCNSSGNAASAQRHATHGAAAAVACKHARRHASAGAHGPATTTSAGQKPRQHHRKDAHRRLLKHDVSANWEAVARLRCYCLLPQTTDLHNPTQPRGHGVHGPLHLRAPRRAADRGMPRVVSRCLTRSCCRCRSATAEVEKERLPGAAASAEAVVGGGGPRPSPQSAIMTSCDVEPAGRRRTCCYRQSRQAWEAHEVVYRQCENAINPDTDAVCLSCAGDKLSTDGLMDL